MRSLLTFKVRFLLLLALITISSGVAAHPATGIVVDRQGNVYFSDLETIWKLDPKGAPSVLRAGVSGRHVHELSIDDEDSIYGADVSYKPSTGEWVSDIWKLTRNGQFTYLLEPTTTPPRGLSIWRDRAGNSYWIDQNNHTKAQTLLLRRTPKGEVTTLAGSSYGHADGQGGAARFSSIGGIAFGPDQSIYVTDGASVRRILLDGTVTTMARDLDFKTNEDDARLLASHGSLAGLAVDHDGNVYVADAGRRRLLKIDRHGNRAIILKSEPPFFPNGVAAVGGNVYVLEIGLTLPNALSGPRIRRIGADGQITTLAQIGAPANRSVFGASAGVATERVLAALTQGERFRYFLTAVALGVLFLAGAAWRRRRKAAA